MIPRITLLFPESKAKCEFTILYEKNTLPTKVRGGMGGNITCVSFCFKVYVLHFFDYYALDRYMKTILIFALRQKYREIWRNL